MHMIIFCTVALAYLVYIHTFIAALLLFTGMIAIIYPFENLRVARCTHDWKLRTLLAAEIERQMSIVTKLPNVSAQSKAFISGRSKDHMAYAW